MQLQLTKYKNEIHKKEPVYSVQKFYSQSKPHYTVHNKRLYQLETKTKEIRKKREREKKTEFIFASIKIGENREKIALKSK